MPVVVIVSLDILDLEQTANERAASVNPGRRGKFRSLSPASGDKGADIVGHRNPERERQDPFTVRSPASNHGTMPNLKWSFADSHMRIEEGGWARETTVRELPISKTMAGVNMRLKAGAVRELHWHKEAEWSYMLKGKARITAVDELGRTFADDVCEGDLWYFPPGIPHSIQKLDSDVDGCEFLLVFDDGNFSEDSTFPLTDWLTHTPRDVLAKNFKTSEEKLETLPSKELYIFPAPKPGPLSGDQSRAGSVPNSFSHRLLQHEPLRITGGTVRIVDSASFPASKTIAAALVELEPGAFARTALASERRRVAVLYRRRKPHDSVRIRKQGPALRLPGRRRRICTVRDGPLYREHWIRTTTFPRDVSQRRICRCFAQPMARIEAARAGGSALGGSAPT